jgi:hypothetical protein
VRSAFWQARFYDFNVWTTKKRIESCATCMAIRRSANSLARLNSGAGAVTVSTSWTKPGRCWSIKAGERFAFELPPRDRTLVHAFVAPAPSAPLRAGSSQTARRNGATQFVGAASEIKGRSSVWRTSFAVIAS